jgi:hypothetical protein
LRVPRKGLAVLMLVAAGRLPGAEAPAKPKEPEDLFLLGQRLFEDFAPAEVKAQYEFPSRAQFDAFMQRLPAVLDGDSLGELAAYVPEAKAALAALRAVPGQEDLADWLEQRLDEMEAAEQVQRVPTVPPTPRPAPMRPSSPTPAPKPTPSPAPKPPERPVVGTGAGSATLRLVADAGAGSAGAGAGGGADAAAADGVRGGGRAD